MKLLVVEDEEMLCNIISKGLKKCGYAVDQAEDGEAALELFGLNEYDLIVLDLNLPKIDGMEVLRNIRKSDTLVKVIILSARSEIEERILGLDDGANDYLVKPFDFKELEARIRCLLRQPTIMQELEISIRELRVDIRKKTAYINQTPLELTKKEYGILEYLVLHKNSVISAECLLEHVYEPFYRADRYRTKSVGGSGLGLAIVKGIIDKHKGQIYVKSLEGEGTTFDIILQQKNIIE